MKSKIDVINFLADVVGAPPIQDLDDNYGPAIEACIKRLDEAVETLLTSELWFNREYNVVLEPNADGEILLNADVIHVEGDAYYIVQRGNKLFNPLGNTYTFDCPVSVTQTVKLEWDLLPEIVRLVAQYQAAIALCMVDLEDSRKAQDLNVQAQPHVFKMNQMDLNARNINALTSPHMARYRSGARPYGRRSGRRNPLYPGG